jgi:hypothetical protein
VEKTEKLTKNMETLEEFEKEKIFNKKING